LSIADLLEDDEAKACIVQALRDGPASEEDLRRVADCLAEYKLSATMWDMWKEGSVSISARAGADEPFAWKLEA
jgi:hypothetical protein